MKRLTLLLLLSGCGGGGSEDAPVHCTTPGVGLWCSAASHCCPDDMPYYCVVDPSFLTPNSRFTDYKQCFKSPCNGEFIPVDYCGEE